MAITLATRETTNNVNSAIWTPQLIPALAIRDTANHDPTTDATILLADARFAPGGRILYIANSHNQAVTITLLASVDGTATNLVVVGTGKSVAASTSIWLDTADIAQLADPHPYVGVRAVAAVSPASGTLSAWLAAKTV